MGPQGKEKRKEGEGKEGREGERRWRIEEGKRRGEEGREKERAEDVCCLKLFRGPVLNYVITFATSKIH